MFARVLPRLVPAVLVLALATPACSEDDPPASSPSAGGTGGAAGATNTAGAAGTTSNAGAGGTPNATGGAGGAFDPVGSALLEATVDGVPVETKGEPLSYFLNTGAYVMSRKGSNGSEIIQVQFSHSNGFPKPFVIPSASLGTERQAIVGSTSVEYWASRQGSHTTEDKLVFDGARIKGTWTFTSKVWGNGSGPDHVVVITIDMPLHPALL